ncbi:aspartate aminotransferase family protein [Christensenellaceae bacterium OttesenSCG-928-M15]|nr:aspartate aminotransferase family protein [Christensenellaceae bacterium OttesenSCG-928-M15]
MHVKELDKAYISNTYARVDVTFVSGKGAELFDDTGKRYIDLGGGIAVNTFGIADDIWANAVVEQVKSLQHVSNYYYTEPQAKLAKLLCERTGMKKVFFSNSGAEANECAIKAARKYASDQYGDQRPNIVTLYNSFHGRTITTLSATGQDALHEHFGPFTPGFLHVHANDLNAMKNALENDHCCAVMMELVQGEGGVLKLERDYVQAVAALCKERDILLVIDEVQTGNGRTGTLYAYEQYGISPDIVSTAKGLSGGLPFGATLFASSTADVLSAGTHGSTFGGNPVCAAAALSTLERIDATLLHGVEERCDYIINELTGASGVISVSGMGLMLGIECAHDAKDVVKRCMERGVIVLTAKAKVRLLPPLNIPMALLKEAISILKEELEK